MNREEEIEQAMKDSVAETIYVSGWGITQQATDLLECAFTKGAKWADENPKEGIVRIKRVCDWIGDNVFEYQYTEDGNTIFDADKFIDDLCKAMDG